MDDVSKAAQRMIENSPKDGAFPSEPREGETAARKEAREAFDKIDNERKEAVALLQKFVSEKSPLSYDALLRLGEAEAKWEAAGKELFHFEKYEEPLCYRCGECPFMPNGYVCGLHR